MPLLLTTAEVSALTGATLRQLQWWDEAVLVRGVRIVGNKRLWNEHQIRRARLLLRIVGNGGRGGPHTPHVSDAALQRRFLLFSGFRRPKGKRTTYKALIGASDSREEIVRMAAAAPCGVLVVELP